MPFSIFCIDKSGTITDCNTFAENLSGYKKQELIGQKIEVLIPQHLASSHIKQRNNYQSGSGIIAHTRDLEILNKSEQLIRCTFRLCDVEDGFIAFVLGVIPNLVNTESYYSKDAQRVLSSIEEAFWEWNIIDNTMYYSAHLMFILGFEKSAFTGSLSFIKQFIRKEHRKNIYHQGAILLAGNLPCINITFPIKAKHGKTRWLKVVGKIFEYRNGEPRKIFGSMKDITENYQLVDQLKVQNNYLQLSEKLSRSGHWRYDMVNNSLYCSPEIYHIHGIEPEKTEPTVEFALSLYPKKEKIRVKHLIKKAILNKKSFHYKSTIVHKLGYRVKVESLGHIEQDEKGKVIAIFGVLKDISVNEDRIEKLKLLALINHTINVPIFFIDERDNVVYQDLSPQSDNKSAILFNYINFSITEYLDFKREAQEKGQIRRNSISFDKFNSVFDLSVTYENKESIYIWIVENVTDKFRKEQQQIISNRLALLGNTFGNVSHDINNVLAIALSSTELLELKYAQGQRDISGYIERVKNAIDKGKNVTERLLTFTRRPNIKVVKFDPMKEIEDNKYLFKQLLLNTIDFKLKIADVCCEINFPQGEFINILLNLVINSQDAIRENGLKGKIEISANINNEQLLEIHVKDSGNGIEEENLSKIFDPFYSSKSVNKGNGIGLANVYSTIYKHNGKILVAGHCELGGAHFTLLFKCKMFAFPPAEETAKASKLNMKGRHALILDDETVIAEFVASYLESKGVITQHIDTKSGLVNVLSSENVFDMFITDMILPDISGREAVALVKAKFPQIDIFSISGYIAEEDNNWPYPVLRKPFNSKELVGFLMEHS